MSLQWAFGVLMWEIFTQGDLPYEHVDNADMKSHIRVGNRLAKPENAPVGM